MMSNARSSQWIIVVTVVALAAIVAIMLVGRTACPLLPWLPACVTAVDIPTLEADRELERAGRLDGHRRLRRAGT